MKSEVLERGAICVSSAGHDSGEAFVITEVIDGNYVLIANGSSRSIEKPKRKKKKHIIVLNAKIELDSLLPVGMYNDGNVRRLIEEELKKIGRSASVQR